MTSAIFSSLVAALDFFLPLTEAFAALATVNDTCGMHRSSRIRLYSATWEATFAACQEAMLVVGMMLADVAANINTFEIPNRDVGNALARALGERERFERARTNYRSALSDFHAADLRLQQARARAHSNRCAGRSSCIGEPQTPSFDYDVLHHQAWLAKNSADDRRGTWYRELHSTFADYDRALRALTALRDRLIASASDNA